MTRVTKEHKPEATHEHKQELTYEAAFARLEEILEKMNSGSSTLDESLKLYEEADKLITICGKRLNDAERKIEVLIKNRSGDPVLGSDQRPTTQDFSLPNKGY